jgi:hypothetical protein
LIFNKLYEILPNFRPHPPYRPPIYFQVSFSGCFSCHIQAYNFSNLSCGESRNLFSCRLKSFTCSLSVSVLYPGSGSFYLSLTGCYPLPLFGSFLVSFPLSFYHPIVSPFFNSFGNRISHVGQGFSLASPSESKPEGLPYILTLTFASTSPDAVPQV